MSADVTVAIPVRNGRPLLDGVLAALDGQTRAHELLICDSGSTDGSRELARRHGARLIEIPPGEFGHGRTRNLLMSEARGERVAFLTQDAEPSEPSWLQTLLAGFEQAPDVALVYGPYRARPGDPFMVRTELARWFGSLSPGVETLAPGEDATTALLGRRGFFTDANGCLGREAWRQVPFRDVGYAEDRALALDMMLAGYGKCYVPSASVLHSHRYSPLQQLRRSFDEARGLHEVYGWRGPGGAGELAGRIRGELGAARRDLRAEGSGGAARMATLAAVTLPPDDAPGRRAARLPCRAAAARAAAGALAGGARRRPLRRCGGTGRRREHRPMSQTDANGANGAKAADSDGASTATDGSRRGNFADLPRRIRLTIEYHGWRTLLFRLVTFPLRFTPLRHRMHLRSAAADDAFRRARELVPARRPPGGHRDPQLPRQPSTSRGSSRASPRRCRAGWRGSSSPTTPAGRSTSPRCAGSRASRWSLGEENAGFAANANRGLRATDPERDVVVAELRHGGAAGLARVRCSSRRPASADVGIVGAQLLYPDGRIQFGGTVRNLDAPEWFDHRYRFKPADWGPARRHRSRRSR